MPKFTPKPAELQSTIQPLAKGDYEFLIGEPKVFARKNKKDEDTYGINYTLTVADGEFAGKKAYVQLYMHTPGAESFSKQFLIASCNFQVNNDGEAQFNAAYGDADWSFDTDEKTCGAAWHDLKGKRIKAALDIDVGENDRQQQVFKQWIPFNA